MKTYRERIRSAMLDSGFDEDSIVRFFEFMKENGSMAAQFLDVECPTDSALENRIARTVEAVRAIQRNN